MRHLRRDVGREDPQWVGAVIGLDQIDDDRIRDRPSPVGVFTEVTLIDTDDLAAAIDDVTGNHLHGDGLSGSELPGDSPRRGLVAEGLTEYVVVYRTDPGCRDVQCEQRSGTVAQIVASERHVGSKMCRGGDVPEFAHDLRRGNAGNHRPPQVLLKSERRDQLVVLMFKGLLHCLGFSEGLLFGGRAYGKKRCPGDFDLVTVGFEKRAVLGQCRGCDIESALSACQLAFPLLVLFFEVFQRTLVRTHHVSACCHLESSNEIDVDVSEVIRQGKEFRAGKEDTTGGHIR